MTQLVGGGRAALAHGNGFGSAGHVMSAGGMKNRTVLGF
jgi:hypothetical protein